MSELTEQETRVSGLLIDGYSYREIAEKLGITIGRVKGLKAQARTKLIRMNTEGSMARAILMEKNIRKRSNQAPNTVQRIPGRASLGTIASIMRRK